MRSRFLPLSPVTSRTDPPPPPPPRFRFSAGEGGCVCDSPKLKSVDGSKCSTTCSSSSFPDTDAGQCVSCTEPAIKCTSATVATAWFVPSLLDSSSYAYKVDTPVAALLSGFTRTPASLPVLPELGPTRLRPVRCPSSPPPSSSLTLHLLTRRERLLRLPGRQRWQLLERRQEGHVLRQRQVPPQGEVY